MISRTLRMTSAGCCCCSSLLTACTRVFILGRKVTELFASLQVNNTSASWSERRGDSFEFSFNSKSRINIICIAWCKGRWLVTHRLHHFRKIPRRCQCDDYVPRNEWVHWCRCKQQCSPVSVPTCGLRASIILSWEGFIWTNAEEAANVSIKRTTAVFSLIRFQWDRRGSESFITQSFGILKDMLHNSTCQVQNTLILIHNTLIWRANVKQFQKQSVGISFCSLRVNHPKSCCRKLNIL